MVIGLRDGLLVLGMVIGLRDGLLVLGMGLWSIRHGMVSSSNSTAVVAILLMRKPALRCPVSRTSKLGESNAFVLDDLTLKSGKPVNEVLIMNLHDH
ncbi:hypothetical protein Tco_0372920, partial [Tanacetum coccineum]